MSRRASPRPTPMLLLTNRDRHGRAGARLSGPGRAGLRIARLRAAGAVLDRVAAGILIKGPVICLFVGLAVAALVATTGRCAGCSRSARDRRALGRAAGAAVVPGDPEPGRGQLHRRVGRPRHAAEAVQLAGRPRRAARVLFRTILDHILAGGAARRARRAGGVGRPARAAGALPARLACARPGSHSSCS